MARKDPEPDPVTADTDSEVSAELADAEDLDTFLASQDETEAESAPQADQPGWLRRLLSLRNSKIPPVPVNTEYADSGSVSGTATADSDAEIDQIDSTDSPLDESDEEADTGAYSDETWSTTVRAAVERIDARAPKQQEEEAPRQIVPAVSLSFLSSPRFKLALLVIAVIFCLSAGTAGMVNWLGQGQFNIPFVGPVSPLLFAAYTAGGLLTIAVLSPLLLIISTSFLRWAFKVGTALAASGIVAYYLLYWNKQQSLVFPSQKDAEAKLIFPLIGECSAFSYWMYFADAVIIVAVLTYIAAWLLESRADEL
ncbi:hypothetical protein [Gimesia sp.]|uniref:hypothetical protein n=1 Tax=Gimesia sp. TaxID=2024833 RepID=UPI0032EAC702